MSVERWRTACDGWRARQPHAADRGAIIDAEFLRIQDVWFFPRTGEPVM